MSATAIATIPPASQRGGVTAASSTPSETQLSADSTSAAASPRKPAAVGPGQREQRQHQQRPRRTRRVGVPGEPAERERREQRHRDERQIGEALRARLFGGARDEHEADHRQRRDQRPAPAAQPPERPSPPAPGSATEAPWTSESTPIEIQNGSIDSQHRSSPGSPDSSLDATHGRRSISCTALRDSSKWLSRTISGFAAVAPSPASRCWRSSRC